MNSLVLGLLGRSLLNRRFSLGLIVVALAAAVALYVSVQNIQRMTRVSFENSIAKVDLVAAARGSDIQILLHTVFGIGESAALMSAESAEAVAALPQVAWRVPVSLGDSHRGFRVIGTTDGMFDHVLAGRQSRALGFAKVLEAVIGADVAAALGYAEGDGLVLQHGVGDYGAAHDDLPFRIAAVMQPTGTPFDQAIFIPLQASEAIHRGWRGGRRLVEMTPEQVEMALSEPRDDHDDEHHDEHHDEHAHDEHDAHDDEHHDEHDAHHDEHGHDAHHGEHDEHDEHDAHEDEHAHAGGPGAVDAVFLGLHDRRALVQVQRRIAEFEGESLTAVIPGVTLSRVWQIIGAADRGFRAINLLIVGLVLLSMAAMTVLSADNRRREMAVLRALGAAPRTLAGLLIAEAVLLSLAAALLGIGMAAGLSAVGQEFLSARFGLQADASFYWADGLVGLYLVPAAVLANLVPAVRLYRNTVSDGIMVER